jgi:Ca2+-binding EF-hand superfamily protein
MVQAVGSGYSTTAASHLHRHNKSRVEDISSTTSNTTQASSGTDTTQASSGSTDNSALTGWLQQISADVQSVLVQLQGSGTTSGTGTSSQSQDETSRAADLFAKIDTNGDGTVTRDEFVAGRPKGVSEEMSGSFYDKIAGDSSTGLTQDQFTAGLEANRPPPPVSGDRGDSQESSTLFSKIDTNGDGTVSRDEFMAGRPKDVTADMAGSLYDKIAGDSSTGLTEDQFTAGLAANRSSHHGRHSENGSGTDTTTASTDTSSTQSVDLLIQKLMAAISAYQNGATDSTSSAISSLTA